MPMVRGAQLGLQLVQQQQKHQQQQHQTEVTVPSFFLCPISLELMRDPVTLSTGMSYDRESIEKWLTSGRNTCPTTNQTLDPSNQELIPNHTLRRLIQAWCVANKEYGVERIPTPRQPIDTEQIKRLLRTISSSPQQDAQGATFMAEALLKLRTLAKESERNRRLILEAGAPATLASALASLNPKANLSQIGANMAIKEACEDALGTLAVLQLSDVDRKGVSDPRAMACLCWLLTSGSLDAKVNAAEVLCSVCEIDACSKGSVGSAPGAIEGLVNLLKEDLYPRAVHAGLKCLLSLCVPRKNRVVAVECNAISILVELLPNAEKRNTERAFALLEILANCAEGREAISSHALAVPMIVKSLLGVSDMATEHAVAALWVVVSYASNRSVINSALQAGAFNKLLMLLPSNCSPRSKHKARETLKLLNQVWGSYTCRSEENSESMGSQQQQQQQQRRSNTGLL